MKKAMMEGSVIAFIISDSSIILILQLLFFFWRMHKQGHFIMEHFNKPLLYKERLELTISPFDLHISFCKCRHNGCMVFQNLKFAIDTRNRYGCYLAVE